MTRCFSVIGSRRGSDNGLAPRRRVSPSRPLSPMVTDPFLLVHKDRLRNSVACFGSTPPVSAIRSPAEITSTLARRFGVACLYGVRVDLWRSSDDVGVGGYAFSDVCLGLGGSGTGPRLLVPSLLDRLAVASEGEVDSAAGKIQPARLSLLGVVRCCD
jgi:hypothetical protein